MGSIPITRSSVEGYIQFHPSSQNSINTVNAVAPHASYDALVIGGGIMGMLTARELYLAGLRVAILEKDALGAKATWAAGGILAALHPWRPSPPAQALIAASRRRFPAFAKELQQETGIDSEVMRSGMIVLDADEKDRAIRWAKENDEPLEVATLRRSAELEPMLARDFHEILYLPEVGQVRPPCLVQALKKSLRQCGVTILEQLAVQRLSLRSNQVRGVVTSRTNLLADKVVICCGAWTATLLRTHTDKATDIVPVRGQMLLYKPQDRLLSHILVRKETYLIPRKDGLVLCGSTLEHVGFENKITRQAADHLHAQAHELCPGLKGIKPLRQWAALRPGTSRATPYICEHPEISGLYFNGGHFRNGIAMSLASAGLLAGLITGKVDTAQAAPYAYEAA